MMKVTVKRKIEILNAAKDLVGSKHITFCCSAIKHICRKNGEEEEAMMQWFNQQVPTSDRHPAFFFDSSYCYRYSKYMQPVNVWWWYPANWKVRYRFLEYLVRLLENGELK